MKNDQIILWWKQKPGTDIKQKYFRFIIKTSNLLAYYIWIFRFYTTEKDEKTRGFVTFSGSIEI